jgi:hypothetical protein
MVTLLIAIGRMLMMALNNFQSSCSVTVCDQINIIAMGTESMKTYRLILRSDSPLNHRH